MAKPKVPIYNPNLEHLWAIERLVRGAGGEPVTHANCFVSQELGKEAGDVALVIAEVMESEGSISSGIRYVRELIAHGVPVIVVSASQDLAAIENNLTCQVYHFPLHPENTERIRNLVRNLTNTGVIADACAAVSMPAD